MAYVRKTKQSKNWMVYFWIDGQQFTKSTRTDSKTEATRIKVRIEDTIELLATGRITVPDGVNLADWIFRGGKDRPRKTTAKKSSHKLEDVCTGYLEDQLGKAGSTISNEKTHISHLKRVLGSKRDISSISKTALQTYVKKRLASKFRGQPIGGTTIRKELVTFRQIWSWAQSAELTAKMCPLLDKGGRWQINIPKPKQKLKFQTWDQITRQISRNGISDHQKKRLWAGVYLNQQEMQALLKDVHEQARYPFIYPMFVLAAYSGARRSEILRSQIEDFNFTDMQLLIRERKRRKDLHSSTRFVPIHPTLRDVMEHWFQEHPGGPYTITTPPNIPFTRKREHLNKMTPYMAKHHFEITLRETKWNVVKGFHVLRHSFGSNLARSGKVSSETIGSWMGHSTEEMREHYQHLFPQDGEQQIVALQSIDSSTQSQLVQS